MEQKQKTTKYDYLYLVDKYSNLTIPEEFRLELVKAHIPSSSSIKDKSILQIALQNGRLVNDGIVSIHPC